MNNPTGKEPIVTPYEERKALNPAQPKENIPEHIKDILEKMREPKMRDIRALAKYKTNEEKEFFLISNITGLKHSELDELTFKEYKILADKLKGFL